MTQLIRQDCFTALKHIPDDSVDLVVTDPPYGINYKSERRVKTEKFDRLLLDDNLAWIDKFVDEMYRVLKYNTAIYVFCSWHNVDVFKKSMHRKFKIKNIIVWNKNNHGSGDLKGSYAPKHEFCIFAHKGRCLNRGKRYPDVLEVSKIPSKYLLHPTEKPVELLKIMIKNSSDVGNIVLDPFMGSGTTGVVCVECSRDFIGIEVDESYFKIAIQRISASEKALLEKL